MLSFLGPTRKASGLSRRDWDRFIHARRTGSVAPAGATTSRGVGKRQIAYDLKFLLAVLNWAVVAGDGNGQSLLHRNPLRGLPMPRELNPKRPMVTHERYEAMLAVSDVIDWRLSVALVMAHDTGHRVGAIRRLEWHHVDLDEARVRWDAKADKINFAHQTWLTPEAVEALERARTEVAGGSNFVLPSPSDLEKPCSRHLLRTWWNRVEELAGLKPIPGLGWHGLRRKFATDLKGTPLKDLCYMGGWKSTQTIFECYQVADEETMRQALEARRTRMKPTFSGPDSV